MVDDGGPQGLWQIVAHVWQQDKSGVRYGGGDGASTLGSHALIGLAVQHQVDMQTGEGGAPIPAGQEGSALPCAEIESAPGMHEFADLA